MALKDRAQPSVTPIGFPLGGSVKMRPLPPFPEENPLYTSATIPMLDRMSLRPAAVPLTNERPSWATPVAKVEGLEESITRSQSYLLSEQKPEGYWVGELIVDVTLVADMVAFYHWWGRVDPAWERKAVNHILARQLPDGGWNIYPHGPSEVNATIKAYLALKLAGVPATEPHMLKAREVACALGGVARMNTFSKLYLALLGLVGWNHVPTIPSEVLLIGKWFHVNFWDMSNWSRAMLVPLAIINHFRPTRPVNVSLDELYPHGKWQLDEALRPRTSISPSATCSSGSIGSTNSPNGSAARDCIRSARPR
jgi:squalene cyclase